MSMLKSLKSLFIIEEEGPKTEKKTIKKSSPTPPKTSPTPSSIKESNQGRAGKVDSKFTNILLKAMDANNIEGFDYLEFKQSLKSLEKMPMDEATRFKSAFAMAQTMGASTDKLAKTAQHYIEVLKKEEQKFEQALENQQNQHINAKLEQVKKYESAIQSKAEKIKQLTKEIEEHQKKKESLNQQLQEAKVKMENTKNDFIASYNLLVSQIDQDVDNIQKHLKGE